MSSQLNVDTIVDKAGSGGSNVKMANTSTYVSDGGNVTQNTVQGLAKSWINPAANYGSILDSYNISSLDDDGTGEGGLHMTNDMSSANYAISAACEDGGTTDSWAMVDITRNTQAAGSVDFESHWGNASYNRQMADYEVYLVIHGDLA